MLCYVLINFNTPEFCIEKSEWGCPGTCCYIIEDMVLIVNKANEFCISESVMFLKFNIYA